MHFDHSIPVIEKDKDGWARWHDRRHYELCNCETVCTAVCSSTLPPWTRPRSCVGIGERCETRRCRRATLIDKYNLIEGDCNEGVIRGDENNYKMNGIGKLQLVDRKEVGQYTHWLRLSSIIAHWSRPDKKILCWFTTRNTKSECRGMTWRSIHHSKSPMWQDWPKHKSRGGSFPVQTMYLTRRHMDFRVLSDDMAVDRHPKSSVESQEPRDQVWPVAMVEEMERLSVTWQ